MARRFGTISVGRRPSVTPGSLLQARVILRTHGQLADAIGISTVHIKRVLQGRRRDGLISIASGRSEPSTQQKKRQPSSLDHLVGAGEKSGGDREPERGRGLEIDDQLEFGWLLNREVGRVDAL